MTANDTHAREELLRVLYDSVCEALGSVCSALGVNLDTAEVTDRLVAEFERDFARLAGLLGYVKADSALWNVRRIGYELPVAPGGTSIAANAYREADGRNVDRVDFEVVRRLVGPWEVVGDAAE